VLVYVDNRSAITAPLRETPVKAIALALAVLVLRHGHAVRLLDTNGFRVLKMEPGG
jgi:hypothetical protein